MFKLNLNLSESKQKRIPKTSSVFIGLEDKEQLRKNFPLIADKLISMSKTCPVDKDGKIVTVYTAELDNWIYSWRESI